jgi:hypothetical protein
MSAAAPRAEHELDAKLANANMFAWYVPTVQLAVKHWPISLGTGLAALGLERLLRALPWPYTPWWVELARNYVDALAYVTLVALAYRFLVAKERVGSVNDSAATVARALQVATIWLVASGVVGAVVFFGGIAATTAIMSGSGAGLMTLVAIGLIGGLVFFLLVPVWFSLGVAGALSTVYAVRSAENGFGAIFCSLRLAFEQKWRVFWPSYLLALGALGVFGLLWYLNGRFFGVGRWVVDATTFATTALGVTMTFVIERAYAPHLTMPHGAERGAALPSRPRPGSASAPRVRPPPSPVGPLPTAPGEIGDRLAADLRGNRVQRLVETVEHGLKTDARFFLAHPDHTLAVAKRLSTLERSDLALRIVQPYLKDHHGHRQHLTVALFVANLLRDTKRLQDAARFLTQVKTLYPQEPTVDQLIKITDRAIAAAGAPGPATAG